MIEISQFHQHIGRNIPLAHFLVRVADLRAFQILGKVFLIKVAILPQIANTPIHVLFSFELITEKV